MRAWPCVLLFVVVTYLGTYGVSCSSRVAGQPNWITQDGQEVQLPCPSSAQLDDMIRLPAGCIASTPGILYTVDADRQVHLRLKLLRADARALKQLREVHGATVAQIAQLRVELDGVRGGYEACEQVLRRTQSPPSRSTWFLLGAGTVVVVLAAATATIFVAL